MQDFCWFYNCLFLEAIAEVHSADENCSSIENKIVKKVEYHDMIYALKEKCFIARVSVPSSINKFLLFIRDISSS